MTDQNGRLSVVAAKLNDRKYSIDSRYVMSDQIVNSSEKNASPFNRASLGLVPPPPDYFNNMASSNNEYNHYEGIESYQQSGIPNDGFYTDSIDAGKNVEEASKNYSDYLDLKPEYSAYKEEAESSLNSTNPGSIYASLDNSYNDKDDYETLQKY